ncbi:UNVERIFIED_CONTAM: hypothetical protein FKN15_030117 [Acipenser sinensis]
MVVVWRRFTDLKKLHSELSYTHRNLFRRLEEFPDFPRAQVFGKPPTPPPTPPPRGEPGGPEPAFENSAPAGLQRGFTQSRFALQLCNGSLTSIPCIVTAI